MMLELFYDAISLAFVIVKYDLGPKSAMEFLERVYSEDSEFLHPKYRKHKKEFFSDVLYWVDYLVDKVKLDREISGLERDFDSIGKELVRENLMFDDSIPVFGLFFMEMRLQIRFLGKQNYVRMKLRTLLKNHGYKRRSTIIMNYVRDCLYFYHILLSLRGGEICDIREIDLDDMITFRVC